MTDEIFCYGKKCEFVRSLLYPSSPIELSIVKTELPQVGIIFALNLLA